MNHPLTIVGTSMDDHLDMLSELNTVRILEVLLAIGETSGSGRHREIIAGIANMTSFV